MRPVFKGLRRLFAWLTLVICITSLIWLTLTWRRGHALRVYRDFQVYVDRQAYTDVQTFDIASRHGVFFLGFSNSNGDYQQREPMPMRVRISQNDISQTWTPPYPLDSQMAPYLDLRVDGVQPILNQLGIGFRLYVANDGSLAFGEKMVPDLTGTFVFHATLPHWLIALVSAGIFLLAVRPDWRARRRRKKGVCIGCGYDLRGSVEAGRCSECGLSIDEQQMEKLRGMVRDVSQPRSDSQVVGRVDGEV